MKTCPNCGKSNDDNMNFCNNCGANIKDVINSASVQNSVQPSTFAQAAQADSSVNPVQPTPQMQQVAQPQTQMQPVEQPKPQMQPVQAQPQPVAQPRPAAQTNFANAGATAAASKTNGLCIAGLITGLISIITVGTTGIVGLILSICGLVSAGKKGNKGKGLAITGLIVSIIMMIIGGIVFMGVASGILEGYDEAMKSGYSRSNDDDEDDEDDEDEDDEDDDDDDDDDDGYMSASKIKNHIKGETWVERNDSSTLVFESGKRFTYYKDYGVYDNYYYEGDYELYIGEEAYDYLTEDLEEYGVTSDELDGLIERNEKYDLSNLMVLVLHNETRIIDGENTAEETVVTPYYGFYLTDGDETVLDIANMNTASYYAFEPESQSQYSK